MRYAVYFTPPADDPLTLAANAWLGRDAFGRAVDSFAGDEALTREPARYGFHGTLKAPFHLAQGKSESDLLAAFDNFASKTPAFEIGETKIGQLGPFFALVPAEGHETQISAQAQSVVESFEEFRAPLGHADIERRNPDALPERQRNYLLKWGYPYVFEEFRFHMTLTGKVPKDQRATVRSKLDTHFAAFSGKPLKISHIALFCEPHRGAPFDVLRLRALQNG